MKVSKRPLVYRLDLTESEAIALEAALREIIHPSKPPCVSYIATIRGIHSELSARLRGE